MPDDTVTCTHCDGRIRTCDNAGTEATPLCQYCYDTPTIHPASSVEHCCTGTIPALRGTILMRIGLSATAAIPSEKLFYIIGGKDYARKR